MISVGAQTITLTGDQNHACKCHGGHVLVKVGQDGQTLVPEGSKAVSEKRTG